MLWRGSELGFRGLLLGFLGLRVSYWSFRPSVQSAYDWRVGFEGFVA